MNEIEKKIQEAKIKLYNEKQNIKNDISETMTMLKVREAELGMIESFIDQLNDLKSKKMERSTYEKLNQNKEDDKV